LSYNVSNEDIHCYYESGENPCTEAQLAKAAILKPIWDKIRLVTFI
jgi:hypothetical protein